MFANLALRRVWGWTDYWFPDTLIYSSTTQTVCSEITSEFIEQFKKTFFHLLCEYGFTLKTSQTSELPVRPPNLL